MSDIRRRIMMARSDKEDLSDYLCIESADGRTIVVTLRNSNNVLLLSTDGTNWRGVSAGGSFNAVKVYVKMENPTVQNNYGVGQISVSGLFNLRGNCMSLLYGDNAKGQTSIRQTAFINLFSGNSGLLSVDGGLLPATQLQPYCYAQMFSGCTSLITAPYLPATQLQPYCYAQMFSGCGKLRYIKADFVSMSTDYATAGWMRDVSPFGIVLKNVNATWADVGVSGVPDGWISVKGRSYIVNATDTPVNFYNGGTIFTFKGKSACQNLDTDYAPDVDLKIKVVVEYGRDSYYTTWKAGQRLGDFQHNQYEFIEIQEVIIPEQEDYYYN